MHKYYFKIRRGELEFAFSTTDKETFEEQLSDWIRGTTGSESPIIEKPVDESQPQRSGFIEVKELVKISDLQSPPAKEPEDVFESILEEAIENPKVEVEEKVEAMSPFKAFLSVFNPREPLDYFLLSAKYLSQNEDLHRFSIKQLNAKLVPATGAPVDHSVAAQALTQGFIEVVPNYTNVTDVTEYTLTESGENYFIT